MSDPGFVVVVTENSNLVVSEPTENPVVSGEKETMVVVAGQSGPPGPRGPAGIAGTQFERSTSGPMSALRIVWEDADGLVHVLDKDDGDHIGLIAGLTITATGTAGAVTVQRAGPVDDDAWAWVASGPIWLGDSGIPTQTPPTAGYDVQIGYAVSPTRIYLDIQPPINLE